MPQRERCNHCHYFRSNNVKFVQVSIFLHSDCNVIKMMIFLRILSHNSFNQNNTRVRGTHVVSPKLHMVVAAALVSGSQ